MKKRTAFALGVSEGEGRKGHEGIRVLESYCVSPKQVSVPPLQDPLARK